MSDDFTFTIPVAIHRPISGGDTAILTVPEKFFVDVEGHPTLAIQALMRFLREMAVDLAADVTETHPQGEKLHHADFVMTTDPTVVQSFGIMHHGCDECEDGVSKALAILAEYPDEPLLVGQLFWAG